jgi:hypothetical protein
MDKHMMLKCISRTARLGLGDIIGAACNCSSLSDVANWSFVLGMLFGPPENDDRAYFVDPTLLENAENPVRKATRRPEFSYGNSYT